MWPKLPLANSLPVPLESKPVKNPVKKNDVG